MIIYLTSNPGGVSYKNNEIEPVELNNDNAFVDNLKKNWTQNAKCLIITADPKNYDRNDKIRNTFKVSFPISGLSISEMSMCDYRNASEAVEDINKYDVLILSGGHVPTQNKFFKEIGLKEKISYFKGIVIGISAGTMNSQQIVYAQPELDGEAIDVNYQRFLSGLSLTKLMILPHYQDVKNDILDGMRVMEDVAYKDSIGKEFICLNDGSYVLIKNDIAVLYGEAYSVKDEQLKMICENDNHIVLS